MLSSSRKKILVTASGILIVFLSFWLFLHLPSLNKLGMLKAELSRLQEDIADIEAIIAEIKNAGVSVGELKQRYRQMHDRFPGKEEEGLRKFAEFARKFNLNVVSISPQPRREYRDQDNNTLLIEGRPAQVMSVSLELKGAYRDLVKYLEAVRELLPVFATVESLRVSRSDPGSGGMDMMVDFNLYLSS